MKNSIKFIYFDLGGVMFRWNGIYDHISKKYGRPIEDIEKTYLKYDVLSCRGLIRPEDIGQGMTKDLKLPKDNPFDFTETAMKVFAPIYETHNFVSTVIKSYRVGLLTNIHHGFFDLSINHGHIPKLPYKEVVQSCLLGLIKPENEIYHHAQKKAKVPHENILFIDDYEENIKAAKELGWSTVHFETDNPAKSIKEISSILDR